MSGVYWGWQGLQVLWDQKEYRGIRGYWGLVGGVGMLGPLWMHQGTSGSVRGVGVQGCIGTGRDCRYSVARRSIGYQGHWGLLGSVVGAVGH